MRTKSNPVVVGTVFKRDPRAVAAPATPSASNGSKLPHDVKDGHTPARDSSRPNKRKVKGNVVPNNELGVAKMPLEILRK